MEKDSKKNYEIQNNDIVKTINIYTKDIQKKKSFRELKRNLRFIKKSVRLTLCFLKVI